MNPKELFEAIRDIPYKIPLSITEEDNCCSGKALRLKSLLEKNGYTSRYQVCEFLWSDINLPEKVTKVPHEDKSTHVFLEVLIDDMWITIDPTWDASLKNTFPISEWNEKNTPIAVGPRGLLSHEESRKIMEESNSEDMLKDFSINGNFYKAFNDWLEEKRIED